MISARNYAAQAVRGLNLFCENLPALVNHNKDVLKNMSDDVIFAKELSNFIKDSVHFALPDNGVIFDDESKGLKDLVLRLPYSVITVEYWCDELKEKIVVFAADTPEGLVCFATTNSKPDYGDIWIPEPLGILLPNNIHVGNNKDILPVQSKIVCPGLYEILGSDTDGYYKRIAYLAKGIEELMEALSCRNVETENLQNSCEKNSKREKQGKLPIYETKFLVITAPVKTVTSGGGGGSHASPRQHLRRGHIRRLPHGNIWVNSCIVGDSSKGVIHKSYGVRKA